MVLTPKRFYQTQTAQRTTLNTISQVSHNLILGQTHKTISLMDFVAMVLLLTLKMLPKVAKMKKVKIYYEIIRDILQI